MLSTSTPHALARSGLEVKRVGAQGQAGLETASEGVGNAFNGTCTIASRMRTEPLFL